VKLTEQMDSHDIGRGRGGSTAEVLKALKTPMLVMGISSDILYPLHEQQQLAK
jgi:homoserine O-acetyltransferase